jgi:hypothetical protein
MGEVFFSLLGCCEGSFQSLGFAFHEDTSGLGGVSLLGCYV